MHSTVRGLKISKPFPDHLRPVTITIYDRELILKDQHRLAPPGDHTVRELVGAVALVNGIPPSKVTINRWQKGERRLHVFETADKK